MTEQSDKPSVDGLRNLAHECGAEEYMYGRTPPVLVVEFTLEQLSLYAERLAALAGPLEQPQEPQRRKVMNEREVKIAKEMAVEYLELLRPHGVIDYTLVGSAAWKSEPVDIDYVVLSNAAPVDLFLLLTDPAMGWEDCDKIDQYEMSGAWFAVRKGQINLIITNDRAWMQRMIQATEVCKYLRLESKAQRIAVNQIIRDGKTAAYFGVGFESSEIEL